MDIAIAFIGAAVVFFLAVWALPVIYDYRFVGDRIEVVLFRFMPVYTINIEDVGSIKVGDWRDLGFSTVHFGNRLRVSGVVVIEKKSGLFRRVAITPRDPDAFVAEVTFGGR